MKKEYDFRGGKRGAVIPSPGKTRITIRIDNDILDWFRHQVNKQGGGFYQNLINDALRAFIESKGSHTEDMMRRILKEELATYSVSKRPARRRKAAPAKRK